MGVLKDYTEAGKMGFDCLLSKGDSMAQTGLGSLYQNVFKDYKKANKWFRLAANQGNEFSQTNLGRQYAGGYGVTKDFREANKWLLKAAEQGNDEAQVFLWVSLPFR